MNQEEALNYSCVNESGCPWEMLKLSYMMDLSFASQHVHEGLNFVWDSYGMKESWLYGFFLLSLKSVCFLQSVMKSVQGLLTFGLLSRALSDRYCKHPTLSAVETKKAGRRLFTLPALEIIWRVRMEHCELCVHCISDSLYFLFYVWCQ